MDKIERLSRNNLLPALVFARQHLENPWFTFFKRCFPDQMLERGDAWLYWWDNRIAGWAHIERVKPHVGRVGFLVPAAYQNLGIGSELVNHVVFQGRELRKLTASTRADNGHMIHLFKKNGFVIEGEFRDEEFVDGKYVNILSWAYFYE